MKIITMTGYRRPAYTREVLAALAACDGIGDWVIVANVEPKHDAVIDAFRSWKACEIRLVVNRNRLGLNRNTHTALFRANDLRPRVAVHLEDDTVPSPDALRYFEWAVSDVLAREDSRHILLASGYNKPDARPAPDQSHACATRPIWTPWGWAVDHARLQWLLTNWSFKNPKCFTCRFRWRFKQTREEIFPQLSRIQNIGYEQGENNRTPEWYRDNHRTPWTASEVGAGQFQLRDEAIA